MCCKLGPRDLSIAMAVDHLNTHFTGLDPAQIMDYAYIIFHIGATLYLKNRTDCVMGKIMQVCILITNRR
jgi:hypothetical protein